MSNQQNQVTYLIREATERVAVQGMDASSVDIMLASVGYLAGVVTDHRVVRVRLDGKALFPVGALLGGLLVGIILAVV